MFVSSDTAELCDKIFLYVTLIGAAAAVLGHGDNYLREGFFFVSFVASNRAPRDPLLIRKGHHDCEVCPQGDAGSDLARDRDWHR
jgi:hypothetical protein